MKNTLEDLHNHLFAQMERLSDEDLKGEELKEEIGRAKSVTQVATKIIENGSLALEAKKLASNSYDANVELPRMLTAGDKKCTDTQKSKKGSLRKMFVDEEM